MQQINVILIFGPTNIGKTTISIKLAKHFNGEIISADSMQIYKYMDIGTAKIKEHQQANIKHYLIDIIEPNEDFSVYDFKTKARELIKQINNKGKTPFIVGGTPLYFHAIINGIFKGPKQNKQIREKLNLIAEEKGNIFLYNKLKNIDGKRAENISPNDRKRIIRALEVFEITNNTISSQWEKDKDNKPDKEINFIKIGLNKDRADLYKSINQRCDEMIEKGLLDEVQKLKEKGYSENLNSMKAIGYKHFLEYLNGKETIEETTRLFKRDTRRLAKRQITFMSKIKDTYWFNTNQYKEIEQLIKLKFTK